MAATQALGALREGAREQVPALVQLLRDGDPNIRSNAANVLTGMGEMLADYIPLLVDLLKVPIPEYLIPPDVIKMLKDLKQVSIAHAPRIAELLEEPNPHVRIAAVNLLAAWDLRP